jgi:hypothetical protein
VAVVLDRDTWTPWKTDPKEAGDQAEEPKRDGNDDDDSCGLDELSLARPKSEQPVTSPEKYGKDEDCEYDGDECGWHLGSLHEMSVAR